MNSEYCTEVNEENYAETSLTGDREIIVRNEISIALRGYKNNIESREISERV